MFPALSGAAIRQTFLDFYAQRGHQVLPSASLVPEDPTVLLTIAGMLPFKPIFLGQRDPEYPRVTTAQKCVRTNDIENVGRTARHHTFFEMLGNFSFGDYFKKEAIAWAWELVTEVFGLPPERLVVSVFREDEEAFALWRDEIGIPAHRIQRMGEADNFWAAGPTGPCGPCSEIYYDFKPELGDERIDLEDDSRFLEIYNLVFMELNRDSEGHLMPLAKQNIDTGLGLERLAQVLQGVPNNYETDLIFPIIQTAAGIAGLNYSKANPEQQISLKVIGDHARAVMHLIADGVLPSNVDRGYVLRRLIRRMVRHGRLLGIGEPFTIPVIETAIQLAEAAYPQVRERETLIKTELQREEEQFLKTLERGERLLLDLFTAVESSRRDSSSPKQISGADAFKLFDTYGFPLELTQEIAQEHGFSVDLEGFEQEMEKQRQRARAAHQTIDLTAQGSLDELADFLSQTEFLGYSQSSARGVVEALLVEGKSVPQVEAGQAVQVVLDRTPFYAEAGGQIGDRGYLSGDGLLVRIEDVQKQGDLFVHFGRVERGILRVGDPVQAQIDLACRRRAQAHHTATHLLQAALKRIVDPSIGQAGSLVAFDRLRFDFTLSRPVTPEELEQIENLVNTWIAEAHAAQVAIMPLAEAKARGAVAMFGEKYGAEVRVIDFPGVSMELCGGTHVNNTAEIGLFKIIAETGVAAGIRRIEAVAGPAVLEYLNERDRVVRELSAQFKAKPQELPERVAALQAELKAAQKELEEVRSQLALLQAEGLLAQAVAVADLKVLVAELGSTTPEALKTAAEHLLHKLGEGAVVLGSVPEAGKVSLVAAFSPAVQQLGLKAGSFIGEIAKLTGGGGGGRPNLAQAGGKQPEKLAEALQVARERLQAELISR
ncbi:alanine--tRNA ligase [Synechococcus sp. JA-2-3B'a(2-13)]|uniref:Alanine--tRNA ligase n=1 Tax=Synechococcus sp. (strain JA-2-3B'a(2-13)) TaxID=321332 RepID=SYA_SYNJB|nr:alanine--tRNA ligase [Synechococcus sp. JA-2-3B'a(2-13)]Q2JLC4.1 RecName: Full=Alanine--tRNA ligase; AltName: Full=Alanyl-tRNA synthetase; Short=AlaRS [Synechococcus sp. JA-2-3B'a(2-13)]ABD02487.1 alanyl-tRNA synthetase [Synechococcus sp. JA-2-3B'a(2-13)]